VIVIPGPPLKGDGDVRKGREKREEEGREGERKGGKERVVGGEEKGLPCTRPSLGGN